MQRFIYQLNNMLVQTLMGSTVICFLLGEVGDALAITAIVLINAVFGMFQEQKADQSLEALKEMSAPEVKVIRDGSRQIVPSVDLVPGDVVVLEAGDTVPADVRLLEAVNLEIEEAAFTGESYPVKKLSKPLSGSLLLQDCRNMAFSGTAVTRGRGLGVVVATGMSTEIGKIADLLKNNDSKETPLTRRMEHISNTVLKSCLLVTGLVMAAGVARGHSMFTMFLTGVSLAVAAIPEGLPATVTVALAAGVRDMARKNAVVRRLPGIETLGNTTVICSDKTGTMTKNELTVRAVYCSSQLWQVSGTGYDPHDGYFMKNNEIIREHFDDDLTALLTTGVLCNDASLQREITGGAKKCRWTVSGDPMEGAILIAARKARLNYIRLREKYPRLAELPFEADNCYMTTVNTAGDNNLATVAVKGAIEKVLPMCSTVRVNGVTVPLDDLQRKKILACNEQLTSQSMRVLALAKRTIAGPDQLQVEKLGADMVFLGLLGMIDPLRPEVKSAVARCHRAGIKVCMITGDHKNTAQAIGAQLGLEYPHRVVNGYELDQMTDMELHQVLQNTRIFARVVPKHKLRLVKALRDQGEVVTMIGDGVNDAPAVKEADVGVAMGASGTEVTKQASVMIITDDNFATLVGAIEHGRGILENIRKSVAYLLATNAGEVALMLLTIAMGMPLPLLPIQLLWLNLLGDGLPALALGADKLSPGLMARTPRPRNGSFFDEGLGQKILSRGAAIGLTTTAAYWWALKLGGGIGVARTIALNTLTMSQFLYALNCRKENQPKNAGRVPANPYLIGSLAVSTAMLGLATYLPVGRAILKTVPLGLLHWTVVAGSTFLSAGLDGIISKVLRNWNWIQSTDSSQKNTVFLENTDRIKKHPDSLPVPTLA